MYHVTISAVSTLVHHQGKIEKLGETTRKIGTSIFSKEDIAFLDTSGTTLISGGMALSFAATTVVETEAAWNFVRDDGVKATLFKGKGLTAQIIEVEDADAEAADEEEAPKAKRGGKKVVEDADEEEMPTRGKKRKVAEEEPEEEEEAPKAKKRKVADPDEEEEELPVRGKRRKVVDPDEEEEAPKAKKRKVVEEEEPEDEDEPKAKRGGKKVVEEDPDEEEEEEEAPKAKKGGKKVDTSEFDWDE